MQRSASSVTAPFIGIEAVPQSIDFPNQPVMQIPASVISVDVSSTSAAPSTWQQFAAEATLGAPLGTTADADYSSVSATEFFDGVWHRVVQVVYNFDVPLAANPSGTFTLFDGAEYRAFLPLSQLSQPIAPIIGPPASPTLNGDDAFVFHSGVGTQPVVAWSAPALGTAAKYIVTFGPFKTFQPNEVSSLTAVLFGTTQFRPPAGFFQTGIGYFGTVSAVSAPGQIDDPIFGFGSPYAAASTMFGSFNP